VETNISHGVLVSQDEMDGTSSRHGRDDKCIQNADQNILREGCHLEYLMYKSKDNIKIDIKELGYKGMDWIHLAHYRVQWRALENTKMDTFFKGSIISWLAEQLIAFQEGLSFVNLDTVSRGNDAAIIIECETRIKVAKLLCESRQPTVRLEGRAYM
jgi:hypothetical protein